MSVKILHTSDLHLGAKLLFLGEKANDYRKQLKNTFSKVVALAISEKVDIVVMPGDMFDSPKPEVETVQFFANQLELLVNAGIYIAIIPGNHDFYDEFSVYNNEVFHKLGDKCGIITSDEISAWKIEALSLTIYSRAITKKKEVRSLLAGLKRATDTKFHVGLFHGSVQLNDQANAPILQEEIGKSEMNYIALGDWHGIKDVSIGKTPAWYSGSVEPLAADQYNSGSVLIINIDEQKTEVKSVKVGTFTAVNRKIDVSGIKSLQELKNMVVEDKNLNLLLTIELVGTRDLELNTDELSRIIEGPYWLRVVDNSQIRFDEQTLAAFPEETIVGQFIRLLYEKKTKGELSQELVDDALQYGVRILTGKQ